MASILWFIVVALVVFWLIGVVAHIAGGLIHILLLIAAIVFLYNLFVSSRSGRSL